MSLHPVDETQDWNHFLFLNNEKSQRYCKISMVNQTTDHVISLDKILLGHNYPETYKTIFNYSNTNVLQCSIPVLCILIHIM